MKHDRILEISKQKLKYYNYSNRSIEIYLHYIKKFLINTNKYPQHIISLDFQKYLDEYNFTSISQQNQIISAIKFFYNKVLNKKYNKLKFDRPKGESKLPRVISRKHILTTIAKIKNLKHKSIITLCYSTGIRVSELINLKIIDIDSNRMVIYIKNGKGRKDRIVPLSNYVLKLLREYFSEYRPVNFLFNGQTKKQYTASSCNRIVKKHLGEQYHMHLLRHSCFTSMVESGVNLRIIQSIAGHKSSKTTEIYTHVSCDLLNKIETPI